jgi:hypothetical protein
MSVRSNCIRMGEVQSSFSKEAVLFGNSVDGVAAAGGSEKYVVLADRVAHRTGGG